METTNLTASEVIRLEELQKVMRESGKPGISGLSGQDQKDYVELNRRSKEVPKPSGVSMPKQESSTTEVDRSLLEEISRELKELRAEKRAYEGFVVKTIVPGVSVEVLPEKAPKKMTFYRWRNSSDAEYEYIVGSQWLRFALDKNDDTKKNYYLLTLMTEGGEKRAWEVSDDERKDIIQPINSIQLIITNFRKKQFQYVDPNTPQVMRRVFKDAAASITNPTGVQIQELGFVPNFITYDKIYWTVELPEGKVKFDIELDRESKKLLQDTIIINK